MNTKLDVSEVLISREALQAKISEIGKQIAKDFEGQPVLLIGILKGSVPFMADLMREIPLDDVRIDFMSVSSYGGSTVTSGIVRILKDLDTDIKDKNVIIVEDIIDSGLTLAYLTNYLSDRQPKCLKIATMLDKPSRRKVDLSPDYTCFEVEDKFIVGYGLDADQKYRNLPYISWIKE